MEITPLGDSALLVRVCDRFENDPSQALDRVLDVLRRLNSAQIPGVVEFAPAYTTVAVFYDPVRVIAASGQDVAAEEWLAGRIRSALSSEIDPSIIASESRLITVPVCYGGEYGPDLDDVARHTGFSADESSDSTLLLNTGFIALDLARAFRISEASHQNSQFRAVRHRERSYPPGRSDRWRANRHLPAAFTRRLASDWMHSPSAVRCCQRSSHASARRRSCSISNYCARGVRPMDRMTATILRPGFLATVQDLGRPGFRQSGVTPGGAVDSHALRIANLLVGNKESDAGLEITLGGLRICFSVERCVAWCGGAFEVRAGGEVCARGPGRRPSCEGRAFVWRCRIRLPRLACHFWRHRCAVGNG
jgi:hypothetical protein